MLEHRRAGKRLAVNKVPRPDDKSIEIMLENNAAMYQIATNQRRNAVNIARDNGFTLERIAKHIGKSYTATRALTLGADKDAA